MHCFSLLLWVKVFSDCSRQVLFSFGGQKKCLLVALDRRLPYTRTTVWELAKAELKLVVLEEWSSYKGDRLNRFGCTSFSCNFIRLSGCSALYGVNQISINYNQEY